MCVCVSVYVCVCEYMYKEILRSEKGMRTEDD